VLGEEEEEEERKTFLAMTARRPTRGSTAATLPHWATAATKLPDALHAQAMPASSKRSHDASGE
jgi:hypothetical protein